MKKVSFTGKPASRPDALSPDQWVSDRAGANEPSKRLTVDVSLSLHQRIKIQCAQQGKVMADVIRELLEKHFHESHRSEPGHDPEIR